jgi:hypothetical protein
LSRDRACGRIEDMPADDARSERDDDASAPTDGLLTLTLAS